MVKSRTSKKSKIKQQAVLQVKAEMVETAANMVSAYVKSWAKTEVERIINQEQLPLIVPIKHGVQVGRYRVTKTPLDMWQLTNSFGEQMELFLDRRSAVLYSILYQIKRYAAADTILARDKKLSKVQADSQHYQHSMQQASKRRDYSAMDVLAARYYNTEYLLTEARDELEKTLRLNKYLKVWETGKPL
jgi:hypothetical protein